MRCLFILILSSLLAACSHGPVIQTFNKSGIDLIVKIDGIDPYSGPGALPTSQSSLGVKSFHSDIPIRVADQIKITWVTRDPASEEKVEYFMRSEIGIPRTLRMGKLNIKLDEDFNWTFEHRRFGN